MEEGKYAELVALKGEYYRLLKINWIRQLNVKNNSSMSELFLYLNLIKSVIRKAIRE